MRTGQPLIARPEWYDRNAASQNHFWEGADTGPHADTSRRTYTVPAGKKAMVEILQATVLRTAAATTLGYMEAWWNLTPSGGTARCIIRASIKTNTVGDRHDMAVGGSVMLFAGDEIDGHTMDLSTGGTGYYFISYKITEFDV